LVVPLVLLCVLVTAAAWPPHSITRAAAAGASAIALGSTWMIGFLFYNPTRSVDSTALYYFPFLRPPGEQHVLMTLTPFLIAILAIAAFVAWRERQNGLWIALAVVVFIVIHAARTLGIPEIVEATRNVSWLLMTIAIVIGVASASLRALPAVVLA